MLTFGGQAEQITSLSILTTFILLLKARHCRFILLLKARHCIAAPACII
ncbi:hypothetical protein LTSEHVI_4625 [Salmonella enterica subsp. enterica serovar Hvittingfoss str. A4-620]|nr:hypothetical protein LTSEHVI_4625 [Salmonella enterica subsp. enterica serovar Hvittingfoss str. A4-620]